ncbi:MAG: thioredoxin-disulfide reductase [Planctomycetes bacterium]|nr:thioredoxin-disulfide reductase [Planctomycetota bacterium]
MVHNLVIIGSGPAGYTAALYSSRAGLKPLMFEGMQPGGQLTLTTEVENYPGFPDGITGPELMEKFKAQAERFGTEFITFRNISKIETDKRPFVLHDDFGDSYEAHAVIIATGATAKMMGLDKEKEMMTQGQGVSACATCDGAFYQGKEVAIVGGGDTAMEEANFLTRFATKVTLLHRRDYFRASKIMLERTEANPKIDIKIWRTVDEILQEDSGRIRGLTLSDPRDNSQEELDVQGLFVAIGHSPNTGFLGAEFERDDVGYLKLEKGTCTSVEGIFAAGDVHDPDYRQAITAAGAGCAAALEAQRWLEEQGIE